jgi:hypothetical protein
MASVVLGLVPVPLVLVAPQQDGAVLESTTVPPLIASSLTVPCAMGIKSLRAPAPPILLGRSWEAFHMVELVYMIVLT